MRIAAALGQRQRVIRQLLETKLAELERQFIERRLSEEQSALETLAATSFPLTFEIPKAPTQDP
ncbi:MAG: hypothetical protein ACJ8AF_07960, partial [Gemmatimonadaceae bacterium]